MTQPIFSEFWQQLLTDDPFPGAFWVAVEQRRYAKADIERLFPHRHSKRNHTALHKALKNLHFWSQKITEAGDENACKKFSERYSVTREEARQIYTN